MFMDLGLSEFKSGSLPTSRDAVHKFKERNKNLFADLERYLLDEENKLSAEEIEKHLFPSTEADIFISHAHKDQDDVIELAVALESLGLKVFVDSCVWGHADELLKAIDEKYCVKKNTSRGRYDYDLRNRSTSNVYMILNSALHKMIDEAELFIFLETENSVKIENYFKDPSKLSSPWIFSELKFSERVRRTPRKTITSASESFDSTTASADLRKSMQAPVFYYELPKLTHRIEYNKFSEWLTNQIYSLIRRDTGITRRLHGLTALDELYKTLGVDNKLLEPPRFQSGRSAIPSWRSPVY